MEVTYHNFSFGAFRALLFSDEKLCHICMHKYSGGMQQVLPMIVGWTPVKSVTRCTLPQNFLMTENKEQGQVTEGAQAWGRNIFFAVGM